MTLNARASTTDQPPHDDAFPLIDVSIPHSARVWSYWSGGKDYYNADGLAGDAYLAQYPAIVDVVRHSRAFLGRAVRHLAEAHGIRQFLDVGTGLPVADANVHEIAQRVHPSSRVVYADNDAVVLAHAQALLISGPEGVCSCIDGNIHLPEKLLAEATRTLDFGQPIGLLLLNVLGHVLDDSEAATIVRQLVSALPAGSFLVIDDGTNTTEARILAAEAYNQTGAAVYRLHSPEQIAGYFEGLELIPPGVVTTSRWRAESSPWGGPVAVDAYCGVGRKP